MGSARIRFISSVLIGLPLIAAGFLFWRSPRTIEAAAEAFFLRFAADEARPVLALASLRGSDKPAVLNDPETLMALDAAHDPARIGALMRAGAECRIDRLREYKNGAPGKLAEWFQHECRGRDLPEGFFSSPPYLHPLGGSFVYWHLVRSKRVNEAARFLSMHQRSLHLLEHWQPEVARWISPPGLAEEAGLSPRDLKRILGGENLVVLSSSALIFLKGYDAYRIVAKPEMDAFLATQGYRVSAASFGGCPHLVYSGHCFAPLSVWRMNGRPAAAIALGFLVLVFAAWTGYGRRWKDRLRRQADQEIMAQTLAHELRHPATSLRLSLEVFRQRFDELPGDAKDEFLRMSGQLQKMNRIMRLAQGQESIAINARELNVAEMVREAAADYADRIQLDAVTGDLVISADPLWLTICLQNLIKNALIHGRAPIRLGVDLQADRVRIFVEDQGPQPGLEMGEMIAPFRKSSASRGLGLGLSLVDRVVQRMGGRLEFSPFPKRFSLVFPVASGLRAAGDL